MRPGRRGRETGLEGEEEEELERAIPSEAVGVPSGAGVPPGLASALHNPDSPQGPAPVPASQASSRDLEPSLNRPAVFQPVG